METLDPETLKHHQLARLVALARVRCPRTGFWAPAARGPGWPTLVT
jgi:hypothetical protein